MNFTILNKEAPAYRSSFPQLNSGNSSRNCEVMASTSSPTSARSYANVTVQEVFPTHEQAVIIDAVGDISIKDYIFAMGCITEPKNIRFASKISGNRVCIYLSEKSIVDKLIDLKAKINVKGHLLSLRPYLAKSRRIVFSNVSPILPHSVIENKLKSLNISLSSTVTFVKAGLVESGYAHIMSFRRQCFVLPEEVSKFPESLKVEYNNNSFWIFISPDNVKCFLCKKEGHLAKQCPDHDRNSEVRIVRDNAEESVDGSPAEDPVNKSFEATSSINKSNLELINEAPAVHTDIEETDKNSYSGHNVLNDTVDFPGKLSQSVKRHLSDSSSAISNSSFRIPSTAEYTDNKAQDRDSVEQRSLSASPGTQAAALAKKVGRKKKKLMTQTNDPAHDDSTAEALEMKLSAAKGKMLQNPANYVLEYNIFIEYLTKAFGNKNVIELTAKYTNDFKALVAQITDLYTQVNDRSLRNRFSRIKKKLENHLAWQDDSTVAEVSSKSTGIEYAAKLPHGNFNCNDSMDLDSSCCISSTDHDSDDDQRPEDSLLEC